jgi:hypothetical protein
MKEETIGGKKYQYWYTSNTKETQESPSARLIKKYGGTVKIVKTLGGWAVYYRGVDLNKIPKKAFTSAELHK